MLNGVMVNEAFDVSPSSGKILLQCEGSEILFRKLELLPLDRPQASEADTSARAREGVAEICTGEDLPIRRRICCRSHGVPSADRGPFGATPPDSESGFDRVCGFTTEAETAIPRCRLGQE
jgi:hypothetical protein